MKPGIAFPDHIKTEKVPRRHYNERSSSPMRGIVLLLVLALVSGVLFFKLVSVQIVKGEFYRSLSDSNRMRTKIIYAPRGVLFDRNGTPLVYNIPGFREVQGNKIVHLSHDEAIDKMASGDQSISVDSMRQYPYKDAFSHVLGYVGQITQDELKSPQYAGYDITDLVGKSGIEEQYEDKLRGANGKELVEVDAMGKEIRTLGETDPVPGQDLTLTLDAPLQQAVYNAMKGIERGAVIVSTPDGQILSLLSKPTFDPNLFTLDSSYKATNTAYTNVEQILTDGKNQPLLNRAIAGVYPPGSTFKIVMAAAGLADKIIDANWEVQDTGVVKLGSFSFSNWFYTDNGKTDGMVNVVKGLGRSNDIFFYKLAEKVGVDRMSAMGSELGLGHLLGIDLPGEASGVLPTEEWKKKNIGEQWYLGDTYHYGIGQGYLLTTPLQVNAWTQAIVNNGKVYQPHLLKDEKPVVAYDAHLSDETVSLIRQGMIEACSTGGTAWPLFNFKVKNPNLKIDGKNFLAVPVSSGSADMRFVTVACKTGSAQNGGDTTLPHAWLTLFAPAYNPQVVVTVLAENTGEGSNIAGPIAKQILEAWFEKQK